MVAIVEALAGTIISNLLRVVTDLLKEKAEVVRNAEEDLQKLQKKLERIEKTIQDADCKPFFSNQRDRDWEVELKDVIYDAEDIIEDYRASIELGRREKSTPRNKVQKPWITLCSCFMEHASATYQLGNEIKKINERLDEINKDREMLGLQKPRETTKDSGERHATHAHDNPRETNPRLNAEQPMGRKKDKKVIIEKLLNDDPTHCSVEKSDVSIISITGQGGIGKTTLAKMVFNEVEQEFGECKWWICVSQRPDRKDLVQKILTEVCKGSKADLVAITSFGDLCTRLQSKLLEKKFLLVLDDVWELDWWWGEVEDTLMGGVMGSRILITSRKLDVSNGIGASYMHKLQEFTFDESWHLFLKKALREGQSEEDLVSHNIREIGERIVKKCGGLPLVVQTVGSMMRTKNIKREDWKFVEDSGIWEWKMPASSSTSECGDILPGLVLSYDDLSPYLRNCFVYCSIYPKDYVIERDKLVMQWVAHGLVEERNGVDVEARSNQYLNDLINRCLIEETEMEKLKLHDLVHDLAVFIAGKEYTHAVATESTRHLSLLDVKDRESVAFSISQSTNKLRTLFCGWPSDDPSINAFILGNNNIKRLRVLLLRGDGINMLSNSIGDLPLLKYLDLSHTGVKRLPSCIGKLYNLQTLNLSYSKIEELPKEMGDLTNLRYLGLEGTWNLNFIAEGLGKLTNLRTIHKFLLCNDRENTSGCNIKEVKCLKKLKGKLSIKGLGGMVKAVDAKKAQLNKKHDLMALEFDFNMQHDGKGNTASEENDVLEALQPPYGLEKLKICHYKGRIPTWYSETKYAMLKTLRLENCQFWATVVPIASLETLKLNDCPALCDLASMPSLKALKIKKCHGLNTIGDMTALKSLTIKYCNRLKMLANMSALESINVVGCGSLEQVTDLPSILQLQVENCEKLSVLANMPALKAMHLIGLDTLKELPFLPSLERVKLNGLPNWEGWPAGTRQATASMPCLKLAIFHNCPRMQAQGLVGALSKGPDCETHLQQLIVRNCPTASFQWKSFSHLPKLVTLCMDSRSIQEEGDEKRASPSKPEVSTFLPSLRGLSLEDNSNYFKWGRVPEWVWGLSQLEELWLEGFTEETSLGGNWQCLKNLRHLRLHTFPNLQSLVGIISQQNEATAKTTTESIHTMDVEGQVASLSKLGHLDIQNCPALDMPEELKRHVGNRFRHR